MQNVCSQNLFVVILPLMNCITVLLEADRHLHLCKCVFTVHTKILPTLGHVGGQLLLTGKKWHKEQHDASHWLILHHFNNVSKYRVSHLCVEEAVFHFRQSFGIYFIFAPVSNIVAIEAKISKAKFKCQQGVKVTKVSLVGDVVAAIACEHDSDPFGPP